MRGVVADPMIDGYRGFLGGTDFAMFRRNRSRSLRRNNRYPLAVFRCIGISPRAAQLRIVLWWTPRYSAASAVCKYSDNLVMAFASMCCGRISPERQLNKPSKVWTSLLDSSPTQTTSPRLRNSCSNGRHLVSPSLLHQGLLTSCQQVATLPAFPHQRGCNV
jgi:hypothetical protein